MPVLRLERASKEYGLAERSVPALRSVTVEIERGEFVALVGRSGCGKSTFLHLAGAMDLPTSGRVLVEGLSTSELSDDRLTGLRRDRIGFVFQFFHLFPTLSALENVEVPLQLADRPGTRQRALDLLDVVGLAGLADRLPYQLSGGQMQRVAIARALSSSPGLVLADEPTGNLDSETADGIMALFRRINTEFRTAIVMATHSRENARSADRVLTMSDGRIVSDSKADSTYQPFAT